MYIAGLEQTSGEIPVDDVDVVAPGQMIAEEDVEEADTIERRSSSLLGVSGRTPDPVWFEVPGKDVSIFSRSSSTMFTLVDMA